MASCITPFFLLKLSLCWGAFALFYQFLLRKETFFKANRWYLLGTLLLGLFIAAIPVRQMPGLLPEITVHPDQLPSIFEIQIKETSITNNTWSYNRILCILSLCGMALQTSRILWGGFQLYRLEKNSKLRKSAHSCVWIELQGPGGPFSFFNRVFVPAGMLDKVGIHPLDPMLEHELVHASAWHSVDVLLLEWLSGIFWFHPLVFWYKKALREVHEYEADAEVAGKNDKKQYGLLLIRQAQSGMRLAIAHHFYSSSLKQRLVMLTKKTSSPLSALKFGLAAPLALFFILLFRQAPVLAQQNSDPFGGAPASKSSFAQPEYPGGMESLTGFLQNNLHYPESAKALKAEGTVLVTFVVKEDGSLDQVAAVEGPKKVLPELEAEALRVVRAMPKWIPAVKNGKIVATEFTLPIRFVLEQETASELFDLDQMPEYPGGDKALSEFLWKNIQYPAVAQKENAAGLVAIRFIVEKDGSLSNFETVKSPRADFAEEAIRVLKLMPHFSPGLKDGQPVRVRYTLPVRFKL